MRYIRTKDENNLVIDLSELVLPYRIVDGYFDANSFGRFKILKSADTIEELCDEFVVKIKTGYLITYYDKKLLTQDANKNGADVYGAIWTDKGLIYVAKMNNKGELELI